MKEKEVVPVERKQPGKKADHWKKEHNQKKFYESTTFKGIKIGYTGDLMDDENVPF